MADFLPSRPVCPECDDTGEIVVTGMSVNPFSGVPVPDPQLEDIVPCPRCSGAGYGSAGCVERLVCRVENETLRREAA